MKVGVKQFKKEYKNVNIDDIEVSHNRPLVQGIHLSGGQWAVQFPRITVTSLVLFEGF